MIRVPSLWVLFILTQIMQLHVSEDELNFSSFDSHCFSLHTPLQIHSCSVAWHSVSAMHAKKTRALKEVAYSWVFRNVSLPFLIQESSSWMCSTFCSPPPFMETLQTTPHTENTLCRTNMRHRRHEYDFLVGFVRISEGEARRLFRHRLSTLSHSDILGEGKLIQ